MFLHKDKCSILCIKKKRQVKMCDQIVRPASGQKDLGGVVMENFTWTTNANRRLSKTMRKLSYLKPNISNKTSFINKLNVYKGHAVTIISYASEVWHPNKEGLVLLQKLQKNATKCLLGNTTDYKDRLLTPIILPLAIYLELHNLLLYC